MKETSTVLRDYLPASHEEGGSGRGGGGVPSVLQNGGAGLQEAFQFLSVRPSVRTSVCMSPIGSVYSYSANIPRTPNIFTDSGPSIK